MLSIHSEDGKTKIKLEGTGDVVRNEACNAICHLLNGLAEKSKDIATDVLLMSCMTFFKENNLLDDGDIKDVLKDIFDDE